MQTINTDPALGVTVKDGSAYYSLGSSLWTQLTGGPHAKDTYSYSPPGSPGWKDGEFATMNMAKWDTNWYSAKMRLEKALGFGTYEQSIKVGQGSGVITAFYLSQHDIDQIQEIDFEFSGNCTGDNTPENPCGTACVQTNVWNNKKQDPQYPTKLWAGNEFPDRNHMPNNTQGWGFDVYRYKINWGPDLVQWFVDRTGRGNDYKFLREVDISLFGYKEDLLFPFISFWWDEKNGWSPDGSKFKYGEDAEGHCGASGKCYQAFFFQSLKFTPSQSNRITRLCP
jgi:hypothetical protein